MAIPVVSDLIKDSVSAFAGGGGGITITRVEVDFGSVGTNAKVFDVSVPGVLLGQKILVSVSLEMPAGVAFDEIEMDPLSVAGHAVADDTVRLIVGARDRIIGKRAINIAR
jgi:hypothetical protein